MSILIKHLKLSNEVSKSSLIKKRNLKVKMMTYIRININKAFDGILIKWSFWIYTLWLECK